MAAQRVVLAAILKDDPSAIAAYEDYHSHPWPEIVEYCRELGLERVSIHRFGTLLIQVIDAEALEVEAIGGDVGGRVRDWIELMTTFMDSPADSAGGWTEVAEIYRWEYPTGVTLVPDQVVRGR